MYLWPQIVNAVQAVNPDAMPAKDQTKVISKLNYVHLLPIKCFSALTFGQLKEAFELYLFVEKFSGTGWDDENKHAVNTDEYITDFLAVRFHSDTNSTI